ncbi:phosphate ABC transporter substrate-binding protein [bacterium]|nr:phosphate ABC transporter substrate-binding protein [candidate division CSSED10-310 bacterium]
MSKQFLVAICCAALSMGTIFAGNVVITGSTTVLPIAQAAAEEFMKSNPDVNISVSGGGSGNGIKAIIDGSCDIATSSRFVKDKEVTMANEKQVIMVPHRIALDCVVPVTHKDNPVSNLTLAQLKDIYTGTVTNWKDVGGMDRKIVVVSRDTSSGTYEVWSEKVLKADRVFPNALLQASNGAVAQLVAGNQYAIGYVGIGYLNDDLKGLTVEGIIATADTALDGSFPVSRELFMFTNGWPTGDAMRFLNYLVSPQGQTLVKKEGFVPIYKLD